MESAPGPTSRYPPAHLRRALAEEVGFGCPVENCGSPYLMWHHFDPPWAERHHHDPAGMVALCRDHHPEADAGVFTPDQLREFKRVGRDRNRPLGAQFNWMRERLLAVVGGNFYYEMPIAVRVGNIPVVWFNRDDAGRLLVNLQMLTTSHEPRMVMLDNFWITEGTAEREVRCPPHGRLVSAEYPNGDRLKIEFRELTNLQLLDRHFPPPKLPKQLKSEFAARGITIPDLPCSHEEAAREFGIQFPIASVEITMSVAGTDISFGPRQTKLGGITTTGGWMVGGEVGMQIGVTEDDSGEKPA